MVAVTLVLVVAVAIFLALSSVFSAAFGSAGFVLFIAWLVYFKGFEQVLGAAALPLRAFSRLTESLLGRVEPKADLPVLGEPQAKKVPQDANMSQEQAAKAALGIR